MMPAYFVVMANCARLRKLKSSFSICWFYSWDNKSFGIRVFNRNLIDNNRIMETFDARNNRQDKIVK
jgi:hypothetical protein